MIFVSLNSEAAIRSDQSAEKPIILLGMLLDFHCCVHEVSNAICTACVSQLINVSKSVGDLIHSAAKLAGFLVEAALIANNEPLRFLVLEVALILQVSVDVRMKFQKSYENQRITSAADYEKYHRHGLSNVKTAHSDVLLEAQRSSEISLGRTEFRPLTDF